MNDMRKLPKRFVIFDTEFTSWEGAQARDWSGENEHREIIQIGAVRVENLVEADTFCVYVKPKINPVLSDFIKNLTHISQNDVDSKGFVYKDAQEAFYGWCDGLPMFSFGTDGAVMEENSTLNEVTFPFSVDSFKDVRPFLKAFGVDTRKYMSSTIPEAFGAEAPPHPHNALNDARSILLALQTVYRE